MHAVRTTTRHPVGRPSSGGAERLVLGLALLLPLGVALMALGQLTGTSLTAFGSPSALTHTDASLSVVAKRPVAHTDEPPPTLIPPTATPKPTATPEPPTPVPTARPNTYTVQPGDELKHIAAENNVSIWTLIANNDIPNPDSLRVGQVLKLPEN
jgi:LysM repeat protein